MRLGDIVRFVEGTSDPAFAVDGLGNIAAWNLAAAEVFGISSVEAIAKPCSKVIRGTDKYGMICSSECIVRQSANKHRLMSNFDIRIDTLKGEEWFNVSLVVVDVATVKQPYTIHIMRLTGVYERLEMLIRDFIVSESKIPRERVNALISSTKSVGRETSLTKRELQILGLVAKGKTSVTIAEELRISRTTVDNHLHHILKKLNAHSRLEAVLRAKHSGLL